jgi:hypothetical protein
MRPTRRGIFCWAVAFACLPLLGACSGPHRKGHPSPNQTATPVSVPTPDTTPVEALRTPAGLVLKTGPEPVLTHQAPEAPAPRTTP